MTLFFPFSHNLGFSIHFQSMSKIIIIIIKSFSPHAWLIEILCKFRINGPFVPSQSFSYDPFELCTFDIMYYVLERYQIYKGEYNVGA